MKRTHRAFASLTALALLLFLAIALSIAAGTTTQLELELKRAQAQDQRQAWQILTKGLEGLKETWKPSEQTFGVWVENHPISHLDWESLSGRVNLNTSSPFLLDLPEFRSSLKGLSVENFLALRTKLGLFTPTHPLSEFVSEVALKRWFTTRSLWNVNTADESSIEQMATERTGSSAVGSALRATLRGFRSETNRISLNEFDKVSQSLPDSLKPLLSVEPELDVNEADQDLLNVFATNPAWNLVQATAKVQVIVDTRRSQPWTIERLKSLLELPDENLLLSYWGVTTRFLGGKVTTPQGTLEFVIFLQGESSSVTPRVIENRWSPT